MVLEDVKKTVKIKNRDSLSKNSSGVSSWNDKCLQNLGRHQPFLISNTRSDEIIGSVDQRSLSKDFNFKQWQHWQLFCFNQWNLNMSFWLI